jgi:altronate dehydratase small subunit
MKPVDNVATVVEKTAPGSEVALEVSGRQTIILVTDLIPFAHKFALTDIRQGQNIIKYGEVIGIATADIKAGQHVHVHNLESCRGRGDKVN